MKIPEIISKSKENNMPAIAITDNINLHGSLEFSMQAQKEGIQPIIGCLFKLYYNENFTCDLNLLVKDYIGFQNIIHLSHLAFKNTISDNMLDLQSLIKYNEGLIALVTGTNTISEQSRSHVQSLLQILEKTFSSRIYIEMMRHSKHDDVTNQHKITLSNALSIPIVASNDVYFNLPEIHRSHEALLCIADGKYITDDNRRLINSEHYFKTAEQMVDLFEDIPDAINNSLIIAKRCSFFPERSAPNLPNFLSCNDQSINNINSESEMIRNESFSGLLNRLNLQNLSQLNEDDNKTYKDRLEYELNVITKMNYSGYFLIVSDFIKWSKNQNIPVGPGRGSGAGSLVAWSLEITDINPMEFGLIFERFLNPDRVSMPDFDIDFCQEKRDCVIEYVRNKYGKDFVSQIITFGKLQARAVIRDVGRVMQFPYGQIDKIAKLIPNNPAKPVTLAEAIEMNPSLQKEMEDDENIDQLIKISLNLEGLNRHTSTHAAGIVIGHRPLHEIIPILDDQKNGMPVSQYSMKYCEEAGLVKFDFLGLKTLTVIQKASDIIKQNYPEFDIKTIPIDDKQTFQLLSKGEAIGVFQLESLGMREALKQLKPDTIHDIIALISLYRPGPMENIPTYIARKHGKETFENIHHILDPILEETFGVIIYQEQVMQIARSISGYTMGEADLLRRAMGKKIKAEMDKQKDRFISGAKENKIPSSISSVLFDLVEKFAGYGFNKSHAAAYALISYQTAFLKANYPIPFFVALLNMDIQNTDKLNIIINELKTQNINVILPDVNLSMDLFDISNESIIYGLSAIKNLGSNVASEIVKERKKNGKFSSIWDLIERIDNKLINRKSLDALIKSYSLKSLFNDQHTLLQEVDKLIKYSNYIHSAEDSQVSLFDSTQIQHHPTLSSSDDNIPFSHITSYELDAFGFYMNNHPIDEFYTFLNIRKIPYISQLDNAKSSKFVGVILNSRVRSSPRGKFISLSLCDPYYIAEISFFDQEIIDSKTSLFQSGQSVIITATIQKDDMGSIRIFGKDIESLNEEEQKYQYGIVIHVESKIDILALKDILHISEKHGPSIFIKVNDTKIELNDKYIITPNILSKIESLPHVLSIQFISKFIPKDINKTENLLN